MQQYESTRDQTIKATPSQAILNGLSPDGGLYVLRDIGNKKIDLADLKDKNYQETAAAILPLFLEDFSVEEIENSIEKAYSSRFSSEEVTPLVQLKDIAVLELFHGPTSAFKDIGLTLLPQLMSVAVQKNHPGQKILILTATSGDTGKAALEGFKDAADIQIMVFYPQNGVSKIQEQQMKTQAGDNVSVCAVSSNFDEAQSAIKNLFLSPDFQAALDEKQIQLSSANSINIGRLIPQMVYYFSAYFQLYRNGQIKLDDPVDFVVPTGNFGNILAGYYAKKIGLPIHQLICASNENHILHDFLQTGVYDANRAFLQTNSPSMDILISSNLERLLYDISGQNNQLIKQLMTDLKEKGSFTVPEELLEKMQTIFKSGYASEKETLATIQKVYEKEGYLLDPHTAVAYHVWEHEKNPSVSTVVLATASPYKFSADVYQALLPEVQKTELADEFTVLEKLYQLTQTPIPANLASLKTVSVKHQDQIAIAEMSDYVLTQLR